MGGGKGSSSSNVKMTPEQQQALKAQTEALTGTFLPAYQKTIGMAGDVYGQTAPAAQEAAQTASDVSSMAGGAQGIAGLSSLASGVFGLQNLFSDQYKQEQINAAMQPAREDIREQLAGQNAMMGGAGALGSSRAALASKNLEQLGQQRLATTAAQASSGVEANRAAAAQNLASIGMQGLTGAQQAANARIGYAQTPQDVLAKYAQVIYGTPQASTTPNFSGTQGSSTSSKGFGFKL